MNSTHALIGGGVLFTVLFGYAFISDLNTYFKEGAELQQVREDVFVNLTPNMTGKEKLQLITQSCNERITEKTVYLSTPPTTNKTCVSTIMNELFSER